MKKISVFQIVVLAVFSIAIVAGVIALSLTKSSGSGANNVPITIWGTLTAASFNDAIADLASNSSGLKITYVEKQSATFDRELIEALASGTGPDAILLPQDLIVRYQDKILPMPYSSLPLPTFRSTFIQEGELFLNTSGVIALPFYLDPMVMYWNRDMLSNAGISLPPKTWDEFIMLAPKLTVVDKSLNILKSAVSLGEFRNVENAKEIISALFLQSGNPISGALTPATLGSIGAINFYTDFANPVKPDYSWNRALPNSQDMFAAGDTAFYFGFASEASKIRNKNPNLDFDVTYFPQPKGASVAVTFGKMQGLAVLKSSPNASAAFADIIAITGTGPITRLAAKTGLPPVRRALLSANPSDPYQSIFYNSAISARAWLDPNPTLSVTIFQNMIESVTSGQLEAGKAIDVAGQSLNGLSQ